MNKDDFGQNFNWGVSTSAYQIEGAYQIDGKGLSIWDVFCQKRGRISHNHTGNIACNHYHHWEEDLSLIKELNIPCYRFSIAWTRILPTGRKPINQAGIEFYNRIIDKCLELGIESWITLYHWDLPNDLEEQGGWANRDIIHWFEEYVSVCVSRFGDRVKRWMVLNEPFIFTGAGYFMGIHAPGKRGIKNFLPAVHHASLAQGMGGRVIRNLVRDAITGTTFSCSHIEPVNDAPKHRAAANRFDALYNRLFPEVSLGYGYPFKDLPFLNRLERYIKPGDDKLLQFDFDFIGVQNYTREVVKHNFWVPYMKASVIHPDKRNAPHTSMNWEIYPQAIYESIKKFSAYKGVKQIIITENGAAFHDTVENDRIDDPQRKEFIMSYLHEVLKAKREHLKINGYFIWTLLDNFEWSEGYTMRFGIVHTDHGTQKRIIKSSGHWYRDFLSVPFEKVSNS